MNFNNDPAPPSTLEEMNARQTQWLNEKPSGFNNDGEYRALDGDIVFFQFVASGNDGDQFIKNYKAHVFDRVSKSGSRWSDHRYCPVQSGETETVCAYCALAEIPPIKERMSFWMFVQDILHKVMPKDKQFPVVNHDGSSYFHEHVDNFMVWHTSAWRESPWTDIVQLNRDYRGLHNFTARLLSSGATTARRYKVYAMPQSPMLTPELYERAKAECESIPSILRKQLASPVQVAPPNPNQPQAANVQPFAAPGTAAPTFGFGQAAATVVHPTGALPPTGFSPASVHPQFTTGPAVAIPPTGTSEAMTKAFGSPGEFLQPEQPEPEHPFDTDEDNKRPMKAMF